MSAGTSPGPWRYDYEDGYCGEIIAADGITIASFVDEPSKVNAALLVSAPCLLAERDRFKALNAELAEALDALAEIIDNAGLINLANGVQLGQVSWYVKATDRLAYARAALAKQKETTC